MTDEAIVQLVTVLAGLILSALGCRNLQKAYKLRMP